MQSLSRAPVAVLMTLVPLLSGCSSTPQLSPESEERIAEYSERYYQGGQEWKEAKGDWLAMGELERKYLVNFLILEIRRSVLRPPRRDVHGSLEPGWTRPVMEIQSLGRVAVPPLLDTLKHVKDETMIPPCIEALAGVVGMEDMESAFDPEGEESTALYQSRLVRVLFLLDDPKALSMILKILNGPYDWQVRYKAAIVLSEYSGSRLDEVKRGLQEATRDSDPSVARKARETLSDLERGAPSRK